MENQRSFIMPTIKKKLCPNFSLIQRNVWWLQTSFRYPHSCICKLAYRLQLVNLQDGQLFDNVRKILYRPHFRPHFLSCGFRLGLYMELRTTLTSIRAPVFLPNYRNVFLVSLFENGRGLQPKRYLYSATIWGSLYRIPHHDSFVNLHWLWYRNASPEVHRFFKTETRELC